MNETKTAEEILSEITGIPVYRIKHDDKGEFVTKSGALQAMREYASNVKGEVTDEEIEIKLLQIADEMPDAEPDYFDALVDGFRKCAKWMRSLQRQDTTQESETDDIILSGCLYERKPNSTDGRCRFCNKYPNEHGILPIK